jgi:hypothetical protein
MNFIYLRLLLLTFWSTIYTLMLGKRQIRVLTFNIVRIIINVRIEKALEISLILRNDTSLVKVMY